MLEGPKTAPPASIQLWPSSPSHAGRYCWEWWDRRKFRLSQSTGRTIDLLELLALLPCCRVDKLDVRDRTSLGARTCGRSSANLSQRNVQIPLGTLEAINGYQV